MDCISKTGKVLDVAVFIDSRHKNSSHITCRKFGQKGSV